MLYSCHSVGLPVEVQHNIVAVYRSICKARQYTDSDGVTAKLLLEYAHSKYSI